MYQAALTLRLDTNFNSLASLNGSMTNFNIFYVKPNPFCIILIYHTINMKTENFLKLFPLEKK
jgi:hypothetical protein